MCSGRPRSVYGVTSLCVSLVVEGTVVVRGNRGLLPSSTRVRACFLSALPGTHTLSTGSNPVTPGGRDGKVRCVMEVLRPRCAGIDVSKKDAKVCVRNQGGTRRKTSSTVTTWGSMTNQILALKDHLLSANVTMVVMESTSDCRRPFYYLLEDDFEVMLFNVRDVRSLPGRKTDVSDAAWLANLGAHGLVRASFVPPEPIRRLRDLTRTRTHITRERTREIQRLEKLLEDALLTELPGVRFVSCGEIPPRVVSVRCHGRSSGHTAAYVVVGGAVSRVA